MTDQDEIDMPSPPNPLRRWFDQTIIPGAIDGTAFVETALDGMANRTERSPLPAIGTAFGVGLFCGAISGVWRR